MVQAYATFSSLRPPIPERWAENGSDTTVPDRRRRGRSMTAVIIVLALVIFIAGAAAGAILPH